MVITPNLLLKTWDLTTDANVLFKDWRLGMAGTVDSNMTKLDDLAESIIIGTDEELGVPIPVDSETLNGHDSSYFAIQSDMDIVENDIVIINDNIVVLDSQVEAINQDIVDSSYSELLTQTVTSFTLGKGTNPSSAVIDVSADVVDGIVDFTIEGNTENIHSAIVSDFKGKVAGSIVANPNVSRQNYNGGETSLMSPSVFNSTNAEIDYTNMATLNGLTSVTYTNVINAIAQQLISFNIVEIYERKYGTIPISLTGVYATDLVDKIIWLKANISSNPKCKWYGYGVCPSGNKAYLYSYHSTAGYNLGVSNVSNTPTFLSLEIGVDRINANGFMHFLACTDASNGTIASTIYTDYVSLDITLNPRYRSVGWDKSDDKQAKIEVMARGKNHYNGEIYRGSLAIETGFLGVSTPRMSTGFIQTKFNTQYKLSGYGEYTTSWVLFYDKDKVYLGHILGVGYNSITNGLITTPMDSYYTRIVLTTGIGSVITQLDLDYIFSNLQLEEGSLETEYTPYTEDIQEVLLRQSLKRTPNTEVKDTYKDGKVTRNISDWINITGELAWNYNGDSLNGKQFYYPPITDALASGEIMGIKYDGTNLTHWITAGSSGQQTKDFSSIDLFTDQRMYTTVLNSDTGFTNSYSPSVAEIKAYFYGWKMCKSDGTIWDGVATKYWKKITDGTGITSTLPTASYVGYTPYKMIYQLATPTIETVNDVLPLSSYKNGSMSIDSGLVKPTSVKYTVPLNFKSTNEDDNKSLDALKDYVKELGVNRITQLSNPNLLINGDFQIWQRGTKFLVDGYTVDRWFSFGTGIIEQITNTSPIPCLYHLRVMCNSIDSYNILTQKIENVENLTGKSLVLSFYVRGVGGLASLYVCGGNEFGEIDLTPNWVKRTIQFPSYTSNPEWNRRGVTFNTSLMADNTKGYELAGVKIELGSIATPFVPRLIGEELELCQRYYQRGFQYRNQNVPTTSSAMILDVPLIVSMRVSPTVSQIVGTTLADCLERRGNSIETPTSITGMGAVSYNSIGVTLTGNFALAVPYVLRTDIIQADAEL